MSTYINDGTGSDRFIGISEIGTGFALFQGGLVGQEVDYVRCDETLDVTVHKIISKLPDGSIRYDPTPLDLAVTYS